MEAQRYPADYDGILAGGPANNWTSLLSGGLDLLQKMDGDAYIPPTNIPAIGQAVIEVCDANDGVPDGVLNDPLECHFDPDVLLCKKAESDSCLTSPQISALKAIYSGTRDTNGHLILPGFLPGAEEGPGGWVHSLTGPHPDRSSGAGFVYGYFGNMVYNDLDWDHRRIKPEDAHRLAIEKTAEAMGCQRSEPQTFSGSWRQVDLVPEVERPRNSRA